VPAELLVGQVLELDVGAVAHGGHCVARIGGEPGGRVVFVRHALPGERVRALVTEDRGGAFCRADAVEVLRPSADRVDAPCAHAGPGGCGGCDWQHASASAQRQLKAEVVREQLARLAGIDVDVSVEALPGGPLGWRTRITYAIEAGRVGLRRHRSHSVELIDSCPLGVASVGGAAALRQVWPGDSAIEVACGDDGKASVLAHSPAPRQPGNSRPRPARTARSNKTERRHVADAIRLVEGPARLQHRVRGWDFDVAAQGFWQVHPAAAAVFGEAVLTALAPRPGEVALDLYAGAGLFTALLADAVGATGRVVGIESSRQAVSDAQLNLDRWPWATVERAQVSAALLHRLDLRPDLVVLDPPRSGAGASVMAAILAATPRALAYVACDPAALARDVKCARDHGWQLTRLRAFDAFPMTHHVECVALLSPE
jgi:tRNA/tmRNA/rRNA uracil-C5-methylase (TrmA/RlmC/RlmD family)